MYVQVVVMFLILGPWPSPCQCLNSLQNIMSIGQGEAHKSLYILVSGLLANIDPTKFSGRNYLVSGIIRQGIRKKDGYTPTTTVSA